MDQYADERDSKLLESDKYTFFVLHRIIGAECKLLLSDHERLIICFTGHPFPVWIWTPDGADSEEMERAYQLAVDNSLMDGEHHFNLKYDLADYFTRRAATDGIKISIATNLLAYDCLNPVKPEYGTDGALYLCTDTDIDELTDILDRFHKEIGIDQKDTDGYRADAEAFINTGHMYLWKDEQGNKVASCKYEPNGDMASINLVFTYPAYRRKHYAGNLVYQVSMMAKEAGYVPMLYTDADYVASNACYEKIGYVLRGKLCTIG